MAFTAADVKNLREMTGVGMMDCKKALAASDGDIDKAIEFLREKGLGHQLPPAAPAVIGVPDQPVAAPLHPRHQIFLFPHPHIKILLGCQIAQNSQELVVLRRFYHRKSAL